MTLPARSMRAMPAEGAELVEHPLGAVLFKKSGGGDAAELQVLLVDPLLFAREPLQRVAKNGVVYGSSHAFGERYRLATNRRGLAGSGQMPV